MPPGVWVIRVWNRFVGSVVGVGGLSRFWIQLPIEFPIEAKKLGWVGCGTLLSSHVELVPLLHHHALRILIRDAEIPLQGRRRNLPVFVIHGRRVDVMILE